MNEWMNECCTTCRPRTRNAVRSSSSSSLSGFTSVRRYLQTFKTAVSKSVTTTVRSGLYYRDDDVRLRRQSAEPRSRPESGHECAYTLVTYDDASNHVQLREQPRSQCRISVHEPSPHMNKISMSFSTVPTLHSFLVYPLLHVSEKVGHFMSGEICELFSAFCFVFLLPDSL